MPTRLPALPALVAARALEADAARAARRALEGVQRMLGAYDLLREVLDDLPSPSREAGTAALARRLRSADVVAKACDDRLSEARAFSARLCDVDSPLALVEVPSGLWEMLSPYLDDAMEPVIERISRRAGCAAEEVGMLLAPPGAAMAA